MLLAISNSQIELSTHKTPNYLHPSSLTPCHVYVNVSTSNNFFNESWLCTHVNSIFLGVLQKGLCFIHPTNHYRMSTVCRLLPWPLVSSSSLRSTQSLNPVSVSLLHHQAFEGRPGPKHKSCSLLCMSDVTSFCSPSRSSRDLLTVDLELYSTQPL